MHAMSLLEKWLQGNAVIGHQARVAALVRVVGALLYGSKLALTHLGRHRAGRAFVKHHIKAVDRLLGNRHLHRERDGVYRALARTVLGRVVRPVILVDWADSAFKPKQLILKAAVPVKGRAISIYEEVHPMRSYNKARSHRQFLHRLHCILPEGCWPIVVTDAGFRGPWSRDVEALGWGLVGRIRNRIKYLRPETGRWCYIHSLYRQATARVRHIGWRCLSRQHQYWGRLYLVHAWRARPGPPRKRRTRQTKYRQMHRTPWLLATSSSRVWHPYQAHLRPAHADRGDHSRPQEPPFRIRTALRAYQAPQRLEALLLDAALATLILWLLGLAAAERQWTRHFQANTERRRPVLSTVFLGQELWKNHRFKVRLAKLFEALKRLKLLVIQEASYA